MFHTREQLIGWINKNCRRRAIRRAIQEDGVILNLGAFTRIKGLPDPGWIVSIVSRYNRKWLMAVTVNEATRRISLREIQPGQIDYDSKLQRGGELYEGDVNIPRT